MGARVLVCGAWDTGPGYPRAESLLAALRQQDVEIATCAVRMPWQGSDKRRALASPWRWPQLAWSLARGRRQLRRDLRAAIRRFRPAAVLVPYPGHLLVREVARQVEVPVVLDLFLSAYDTAVLDRGMFRPRSPVAGLLRWVDRQACAAADLVLLDTEENADFAAQLTGLPRSRFAAAPVSDPAAPAVPAPYSAPLPGGVLELLFFGTGVPLHGLWTLLAAVQQSPGVRLTLVGGSAADRARAAALASGQIALREPFVSRSALQGLLDACHLVAGIFGTSSKADRVIPYKVVHGLASARPVLTGRTAAVGRMLRDGEEVLTCRAGDARDLSRVLDRLREDPSPLPAVATAGRAAYERCFSTAALGQRLRRLLRIGDPGTGDGLSGAAGSGVARSAMSSGVV